MRSLWLTCRREFHFCTGLPALVGKQQAYVYTADVQIIFQLFRCVLFFALRSHAFSDVGWRCARSCCKLCSSEPSLKCHTSRVLFCFYVQNNYALHPSHPKSVHLFILAMLLSLAMLPENRTVESHSRTLCGVYVAMSFKSFTCLHIQGAIGTLPWGVAAI